MNIAVVSFKDFDVSEGLTLLLNKYKGKTVNFFLPVLKKDEEFIQSVLRTAINNNVKVNCFFESAVGLDHLLKQADDITLTENPVKEVIRHLKPGDSVAMVWDDSPQAHYVLHSVEDLALDTWDIFEGLEELDIDDFDIPLDGDEIHDQMIATMGKFVDLMCAWVANTVMQSLSEAVAEHIIMSDEDDDKKDIDPFNNLG